MYNLFQKIQNVETLPNSFYKASIILISNTTKALSKKRENYRPIFIISININILTKYYHIKFTIYKKKYIPSGVYCKDETQILHWKINQCNLSYTNRQKRKVIWVY